ncbi:hypothetical protein [Pendulispora albinea]|uniref:Lipoprotein n=1 Tax=Pendulispora albinea TaxID=2741071 RepID=A0ABZ2LVQ0_9BACT
MHGKTWLARRRALWIGLLAVLTSCATEHTERTAPPNEGVTVDGIATADQDVLPGPLVSLPDSLKESDFRLSPPPVRERFASRSGDGKNTVVQVEFGPDARLDKLDRLVIHPDGKDIVLSRVSQTGFAAPVPIPFDTVRAEQQRIRDAARKLQLAAVPTFENRVRVDDTKIDFNLEQPRIQLLTPALALSTPSKTLAITSPAVVEDPTRTVNPCTGVGTPMGKWTFGHLMADMAGPTDPAIFTQKWLETWLTNQVVNGFTIPARGAMATILSSWPKLGDGRLDLAKAPLKLLAIVNRIDLAGNSVYGPVQGAEGRFVFEFLDPASCRPKEFLVILEYGVPRSSCTEMRDWAHQWLNLQTLALGSAAYNAALEAITEQFAGANADPSKPNGSALNQLRTNEIALGRWWELREFHLAGAPALLRPAPVVQNPDARYNTGGARNADLSTYINTRETCILNKTCAVPLTFPMPPGGPMLGASTLNNFDFWNAPGIMNNKARQVFSRNTCNGCHGRETNTRFVHISTAPFGGTSTLSGFMTGISVPDPTGNPPSPVAFHDLADRNARLHSIANKTCRLDAFQIPERLKPLVFLDPFPPVEIEPILASH